MNRKIIVTEDNSKTLLIPALNETYHSKHGALQEAKHVFIQYGLSTLPNRFPNCASYSIFELGLGTGLNALVSLDANTEPLSSLLYTSIEKYPLDWEEAKQLGYDTFFNHEQSSEWNEKIHTSPWNEIEEITSNFQLLKLSGDIKSAELPKESYHCIYFDAFGPRVQQDLWSVEILRKMYDALKANGILVTYCAQGQFKRNLAAAGFHVEELPGPPGKREMTRGVKTE